MQTGGYEAPGQSDNAGVLFEEEKMMVAVATTDDLEKTVSQQTDAPCCFPIFCVPISLCTHRCTTLMCMLGGPTGAVSAGVTSLITCCLTRLSRGVWNCRSLEWKAVLWGALQVCVCVGGGVWLMSGTATFGSSSSRSLPPLSPSSWLHGGPAM